MEFDIAVVGAGPAGLCFARSLAGSDLSVVLIERQPPAAIAEPAFDGREIALAHASRAILGQLGLWGRLDPDEVSELRDARVMNGASSDGLHVSANDGRTRQRGWLVPNHLVRRVAYEHVAPKRK